MVYFGCVWKVYFKICLLADIKARLPCLRLLPPPLPSLIPFIRLTGLLLSAIFFGYFPSISLFLSISQVPTCCHDCLIHSFMPHCYSYFWLSSLLSIPLSACVCSAFVKSCSLFPTVHSITRQIPRIIYFRFSEKSLPTPREEFPRRDFTWTFGLGGEAWGSFPFILPHFGEAAVSEFHHFSSSCLISSFFSRENQLKLRFAIPEWSLLYCQSDDLIADCWSNQGHISAIPPLIVSILICLPVSGRDAASFRSDRAAGLLSVPPSGNLHLQTSLSVHRLPTSAHTRLFCRYVFTRLFDSTRKSS